MSRAHHQAPRSAFWKPADGRERTAFCFAYAEMFDGTNHERALNHARFKVLYTSAPSRYEALFGRKERA